jgi:hypothetical protein
MPTNGTTPDDRTRDRRTSLLVGLVIVVAMLVFLVGYLLGRANDTAAPAASAEPSLPVTPSPKASPSASEATPTPIPSSSEPGGDGLPDDAYFVQLADLEGGEDGPSVVVYDLAYFLTGQQADDAAAARGLETPVPDGYFIVNDNHKLRNAPLADDFSVKYIPEGSALTTPVKAHAAQFLGWLSGSVQTDFPPKDTSWWWVTLHDGHITLIKQQYLP